MPTASGPKGHLDNNDYDVVTGVEHHKIHDGEHFYAEDYDADVDIAGPKYYLMVIPANGEIHWFFDAFSDGAGIWQLFEDSTVAGGNEGVALTAINNFRSSLTAATLLLYKDPVVGAEGTQIGITLIPSAGKKEGAATSRTEEIILKPSSQCLIKFTPTANDTAISIAHHWYERD